MNELIDISIPVAGITALTGYLVVFFGLVLLMLVVQQFSLLLLV